MIQLLVKKVLTYGFRRYLYPNMNATNFQLVWKLLVNNFKSLPLRSILTTGTALMSNQKILRAMTSERILDPIIKTSGVTKTEISEGKNEQFITWIFTLISFTRLFKGFIYVLLWFPKLIFTLFILSLTSIDVSGFQGVLSWLSMGLSSTITSILSSIWSLIVYIFMTGEVVNINSLLNSKLDNNEDISPLDNTIPENDKKSTGYSTSQKRVLQIVGFFVLNILLKKFIDQEFIDDFLKERWWGQIIKDTCTSLYATASNINNKLIDNVPLYGRIEGGITYVSVAAWSSTAWIFNKTISTPAQYGYSGVKKTYSGISWTLGKAKDYGFSKPYSFIKSFFVDSSIIDENAKLKEELESMKKSKTVKRSRSITSWWGGVNANVDSKGLGSGASAWNSVPATPLEPTVSRPWGNEPVPSNRVGAMSAISEKTEEATVDAGSNDSTPKSEKKDISPNTEKEGSSSSEN